MRKKKIIILNNFSEQNENIDKNDKNENIDKNDKNENIDKNEINSDIYFKYKNNKVVIVIFNMTN